MIHDENTTLQDIFSFLIFYYPDLNENQHCAGKNSRETPESHDLGVAWCRRIFRNQDKSEPVPKYSRIFRNHSDLSSP